MKRLLVCVEGVKKINSDVHLLWFTCDYISKTASPGQFLHVKVDTKVTYLRRPLSIHKITGKRVFLLFRARGRGTKILSRYRPHDTLDIVGPLGKGFILQKQSRGKDHSGTHKAILLGGGMGVAPLVFLAQKLKESDPEFTRNTLVLLGAKTKHDFFCIQEFRRLGCAVDLSTDNGSLGFKGPVTGLLDKTLATGGPATSTTIYACGPKDMLYCVHRASVRHPFTHCQVSFEQFMGCGVGICCGCIIDTKSGYKKVCSDGPVFNSKEVW